MQFVLVKSLLLRTFQPHHSSIKQFKKNYHHHHFAYCNILIYMNYSIASLSFSINQHPHSSIVIQSNKFGIIIKKTTYRSMRPRNYLKMKLLPYMHPHNNDRHMSNSHADADYSASFFIVVGNSEIGVMKILAQALVLTLLIMVLMPSLSESLSSNEGSLNLKKLPLLLDDLASQGLLTSTPDKSLVITKDDIVTISTTGQQRRHSPVPQGSTFDFAFTHHNCFFGVGDSRKILDQMLKNGGIVVVQITQYPTTTALETRSSNDYRMVYYRRGFDSKDDTIIIALRKVSNADANNKEKKKMMKSPTRKLLEYYFTSERRKNAIRNLEDVLLEPPRSASGKSKGYLRKTKFLPDLLNDSLEGYPRRVYVDVGGNGTTRWFEQNYPTRNKEFDMYRIETVADVEREAPTQMGGISDWLWRNVKEEEYVVMKAEAEVVEEMIKSKAIVLVDELFLECKPKPWGKTPPGGAHTRRAYWECLALYGRLTDFGVAVHQWWA